MNFFLDLETTSLDTDTAQITQAALMDEGGKVLFAKCYGIILEVFEPREVSLQGLEYSHYPEEYWGLPGFKIDDLSTIVSCLSMEGAITWAHNAAFDHAVLQATANRLTYGLTIPPINCTMRLAQPIFAPDSKTGRMKLPVLSLSSTPHDAVSDANNCRLLWHKCNNTGP
jgi:hypothetical protein